MALLLCCCYGSALGADINIAWLQLKTPGLGIESHVDAVRLAVAHVNSNSAILPADSLVVHVVNYTTVAEAGAEVKLLMGKTGSEYVAGVIGMHYAGMTAQIAPITGTFRR